MAIQFTGLASGLDTQSIIKDLMKVERTRVETVEKDKVLAEWKKEAWSSMNTKLYSFYKEELFSFKSAGTYSKKKLTSSNENLVSLNTSSGAVRGSHSIEVTTMAKGSFLTGETLTGVTSTTTAGEMMTFADPDTKNLTISLDGGVTTQQITIEASDTMANITSKIKDLGLDLNVSYDSNFNRLFLSSTNTGSEMELQVAGDEEVLNGLGFILGNRIGTAGSDATFKYNGTDLTSSTNEVIVNGLSFNILGEGGSSTISVTQDTEAIYDSVKSFVTKYNELMLEMDGKISADSARTYKPLTSEEKSAMSEDDIKLWEEKIKVSLLRRDDTLTSIMSGMRNTLTLSSGVDTTGFTFRNLSSLGIVTGSYTEKGVLHIDGDEDDDLYSIKENKLRNAINEDPDAVMELMTSLGNKLYSDMSDKMKSSSLSSALTFYNDKMMDNQVKSFDTKMSELEVRLASIEERYYKQFTAMEKAMQQANSTGNWLAQQLGGL
ncbi:Flagellar hook-associated protein 2 [Petrocella atlantisensis]|uniref:Flagellar hook-associated protein 2 n=1 Tax=Petrocella atlantisensis TaxID=2173034 RepID=A0A3P7PZJ1_9FIRM|nr:flagellar filament capping protein FliD [Petrocella atlantisensis]VDN48551.1 Flagellar hook-associated protein 2 [Petrocella atlantisensis]